MFFFPRAMRFNDIFHDIINQKAEFFNIISKKIKN